MTECNLKNVVLDTSALINSREFILKNKDKYKYIVGTTQCVELDNQKESSDNRRAYIGREGLRTLFVLENDEEVYLEYVVNDVVVGLPESFDIDDNDNKILSSAMIYGASIITHDKGMNAKAKALGIEVISEDGFNSDEFAYKGYKKLELNLSEETDEFILSSIYGGTIDIESLGLIDNEYLIIVDIEKDEEIDAFRLKNGNLERVPRKTISSMYLPKVKGRDFTQHCAIDSLYNNDITMITGRAGSGKTHLSLAYCMEQIDKGKFERIIFFVNPTPAKNAQELGFRPGSTLEKLMSSSAGVCLSSKFGSGFGLMKLIDDRKIEILPMVDIRGLDTGEDVPVIIYILEAQNLDVELMKLALQRCGKSAKIIIDGDDKTQVDKISYAGKNNGMKRLSEVFRGLDFYGEIELENIYRSKIAEIADKM